MNPRSLLTSVLVFAWGIAPLFAANARVVVPVWPGDAPGSEGVTATEQVRVTEVEHEHVVTEVHRPTLTVYLPDAKLRTGAAVVICPGGGHRELWMDHEGHRVGQFLAEHGIAGFVLKYRLARQANSHYSVENDSLADLQRAIQLVRSRAAEWQIDPARVGVIGFSAGGHLAGLSGAREAAAATKAGDAVAEQSVRPAFQALIYAGNAQGLKPAAGAPPVFLAAGDNDRPEISQGAAQLYLEFKRVGVSAELHLYAGVGHGFGIRESDRSQARHWPAQFREWLDQSGFLKMAK